MFHLIWYIFIGLIAGVIARSVMHVHMTIFWTIVLGIIGSILGGGVTHMFSRPSHDRYHLAGTPNTHGAPPPSRPWRRACPELVEGAGPSSACASLLITPPPDKSNGT